MRSIIAVLAAAAAIAASTAPSAASTPATASWYGPGLYGNKLGCGGRLYPTTWGVAHKTLRCGAKVRLCYRSRCVSARVIDRGPYVFGRQFDLTVPVRNALRTPGVATIRWSLIR